MPLGHWGLSWGVWYQGALGLAGSVGPQGVLWLLWDAGVSEDARGSIRGVKDVRGAFRAGMECRCSGPAGYRWYQGALGS